MAIETFPFDTSEYAGSVEAQIELLQDALDTADPVYIAHALGVVARARGMTSIANEAGVTREALYTALRETSDPKLRGVMKALGVKLTATTVAENEQRLVG